MMPASRSLLGAGSLQKPETMGPNLTARLFERREGSADPAYERWRTAKMGAMGYLLESREHQINPPLSLARVPKQ